MMQAKQGDTVKVHYTGKLDDGTVFGSSIGQESIQFTIGLNEVIPGFENAVIGMNTGETRTTSLISDEAYGPRHDELVMEVARGELPADFQPQVDQELQLQREDGEILLVRVIKVTDSGITLDANHPLAGRDLTFDIQLVEIT
jgi:FKBP-type peptidyl-prolyl cis-trans isomerase 2